MQRRFAQLDVFDSGPFTGNPLAVVLDAEGLTTDALHRITEWTTLSEATFLLPPTDPTADYRVRIFCPGRELPFAGHPTLGSCRAWLDAGGSPKRDGVVVQECGAGLVEIRVDGDDLAFASPPLIRSGPIDPDLLAERVDQLGIATTDVVDAAWIDNGPGWMGLLLASVDAVLAVVPPAQRIRNFDVGLVGLHSEGSDIDVEVRALFADAAGAIREDPVTGSLNASVGQWRLGSGRLSAPYVAAQGRCIGQAGRITVDEHDDCIWVGGHTTVSISGTIDA